MKRPRLSAVRIGLVIAFLMGALALTSADGPYWTENEKPYYADQALINFVRPGLRIQVLSASVAADGTISARVKFTDPAGLPLDKDGITTPGRISNGSPGMLAAYIPKGQTQYVSYVTRPQTSPITNKTENQARNDSGGTWKLVADGEYTYTFATKAPATFDKTATHTIGVYGARNLTEFDMGIDLADTTFNFVPDGSKVTQVRDVIRTETCAKCHNGTMYFHGETGRKSMEVCILCHQPQTVDPDTGNTVDMPVMIHKIHMGEHLPSVAGGKPYRIIGNAQSVNDYSEVAFPSPVQSCQTCHESNRGATQADAWITRPNRAACGACHDDVNFATGDKHVNLPQVSDSQCSTCHNAQGELDFDASIKGAHVIPQLSTLTGGLEYAITKVDNGVAGKAPTVTFTLKDRAGKPLALNQMARLALVIAGPTTDYNAFSTGYVSEDALTKSTGSNGTFTYTFTQVIPANAKGTFTVGIEGRRLETVLAGTKQERSIQYGAPNKVMFFAVDGSRMAPRRQVVTNEKCLACHTRLALHGENRVSTVEQCVLCHNPVETDKARRPAAEGAPQTVDFRWMIHRIHGGEEVTATAGTNYTVYGFGGSKNDFSNILYPARLSKCDACHVNGSENPPLPNHAPVNNQRFLLNPTPPVSAACLACHQTVDAASHALANTTEIGESCSACHGASAEFSVSRVHAAEVR